LAKQLKIFKGITWSKGYASMKKRWAKKEKDNRYLGNVKFSIWAGRSEEKSPSFI